MGKINQYKAKNFNEISVGKAGTIAKNGFGIFETLRFRENSE